MPPDVVPGGRQTGPLVTVGIPAYNAQHYLAEALDSLLAQTLADFELVISDNASTDATQAICEDYARRDSRIRYIRQPVNIGAPRNWNAVVHAARGVYFKWASASDYCAPQMLAQCVAAMKADPGVVLCYGKTQFVDEEGVAVGIYERELGFEEPRASDRIMHICDHMTVNNLQCGVFRLDALRQTGLDRLYPSGDIALMAELTLYGRFRLLPDVLLFRRQSRESSTAMLSAMEVQKVYDPNAKKAIGMLRTRRYIDNLASILRAPLPFGEKLRALKLVSKLIWWDRTNLRKEMFH